MSEISKVLFATTEDISMWMSLVEVVKDNFPGLEMDSYLNTLKCFMNLIIQCKSSYYAEIS